MGNSFETATAFHLGYRRWLDGLRGLAILLVLAFHFKLLPGGSLGVDVFFVLSGFLITCLLVEEWQRRGSIRFKRFYLRRALRLLPAFLTVMLVWGLATWLLRPAAEAAAMGREMIVAVCYVSNWPLLHGVGMPRLGYTWSLSLEEQFYVLWPALLCLMLWLRLRRRRIILILILGIVASATLRLVLYRLHSVPGAQKQAYVMRLYMGLDSRADALLVGCLAGLLASWNMLPKSPRFVAGMGMAAAASAVGLGALACCKRLDHSEYYHGMFTVAALMAAIIIVRLLSGPWRTASRVLESAPLVGLGRISYGLYLFHIPILAWMQPAGLGWRYPASTLLVAALSLGAALGSYYCVERPCLRWKSRLADASPRTVTGVTAGGEAAPATLPPSRAAA